MPLDRKWFLLKPGYGNKRSHSTRCHLVFRLKKVPTTNVTERNLFWNMHKTSIMSIGFPSFKHLKLPISLIGVTMLCHWARHINPSLVLVQPRKTRPYITERLLTGRKESNQTNKNANHYLNTCHYIANCLIFAWQLYHQIWFHELWFCYLRGCTLPHGKM